jgi:hypothetical protein
MSDRVKERMLDGIATAAGRMRDMRRKEGEARDELRLIVSEAVQSGVPVAHIARAAGWSQRASVYNLMRGK